MGDLSTTLGDEDLPGLPLRRLRPYLREQVPEISDPRLRASLISGGRSNLTYLLTDGRSRWVLRRPPLGAVPGDRSRHGPRVPDDRRPPPHRRPGPTARAPGRQGG
ncbi:hypothetical protein LP422_10050 [Janibacter limosus]|uniref:Uncharacterized protein n=1 Tax=Janibacter limosus TaxID=53458 RepID=A0AC61U817_9MICO|nr:hypothetical protein [Janibacter limosus]UUZ46123.1 hypothetical protein LP422_10050 [Janibacter limosus]